MAQIPTLTPGGQIYWGEEVLAAIHLLERVLADSSMPQVAIVAIHDRITSSAMAAMGEKLCEAEKAKP